MREILLMSFLGPDRPRQFTRLMGVLARHGLDLLDAGQAVIHDQLTLGLVISSPDATSTALAMRDMLLIGQEIGLTVRFEPISAEQYEHWVGEGGQTRHIRPAADHQIAQLLGNHTGSRSTSRTITAVCALPSSGVHRPSQVEASAGSGAPADRMRSRG